MFGHQINYRLFFVSSLLLLTIACNNKTESIESLIDNNNSEALQLRRNEIQRELQRLQESIVKIDDYFSNQENDQQTALVTIDTLRSSVFKHFIEVQGDLATDENILIHSETSGVIQKLPIRKGQAVNKGQILMTLDDGGLSNQLIQLQTQMDFAKTTFERQSRLWENQIGSEIQYLQAKTNYESAESAVKQLESQINKTNIRAPFSGVIDELLVEQGELSLPGQTPLLRLVNLNNLYVDANIPENYLPSVKIDTEVEIYIRSIDKRFQAKVKQIGKHIHPENRTFKTRILIPEKIELARPNQIASIHINDYTKEEAILIPNAILQVNAQGESYVYTYEKDSNGKAISKRRIIQLGKTQDNKTEVLSGLASGDIILLDGAKSVRDGQRIRLQN